MLAGPSSALPLPSSVFSVPGLKLVAVTDHGDRRAPLEKTYFPSFNKKEDSLTTWRDLPSPAFSKAIASKAPSRQNHPK